MKKNIQKYFDFAIFDVDGTLINNMPLIRRVFAEILKEKLGLPQKESIEFLNSHTGLPVREIFEQVLITYHKNTDYEKKDVQRLTKLFLKKIGKDSSPCFGGVKEVLSQLQKNLRLFSTSGNSTQNVKISLSKAGLADYFDLILGSEKIPKGKEHIKVFAKSVGLSFSEFASKAFLVGDGKDDMAMARQCGIYAIGITNTVPAIELLNEGADEIIDKLEKLLT
ncbi:MAG: HAD family hydrolase [Chloroflexota bacterium]|nr:HAD family hydrolase [Chloroflexota bacterium]